MGGGKKEMRLENGERGLGLRLNGAYQAAIDDSSGSS